MGGRVGPSLITCFYRAWHGIDSDGSEHAQCAPIASTQKEWRSKDGQWGGYQKRRLGAIPLHREGEDNMLVDLTKKKKKSTFSNTIFQLPL